MCGGPSPDMDNEALMCGHGRLLTTMGAGVAAMLDCDHHVIGRSLLTVMTLDSFMTVEEELSRLLRETLERAGKAEKHVSDFARTSFPVVRL